MDNSTHNKARHLVLVWSRPEPAEPARPAPAVIETLTGSDIAILSAWMDHGRLHGYARMVIEHGKPTGLVADAGYALIYEPGQEWATWGVRREGATVVVWRCGQGRDTGRFDSMQAAVASLPILWRSRNRDASPGPEQRSEVVRLRG